MDYPGGRILLQVESEFEYKVRLQSCAKEPGTVRWIETDLRGGDVLFDVGANVGAYSLVAAICHGRSVRVFAFEPAALTYGQLVRNVALNHVEGQVTPMPVALSNHTGLEILHYSTLTAGAALHSLGSAAEGGPPRDTGTFQQPVVTFRLDDLIREFSLPVPSHIKIDVDGAEERVLAGAAATLGHPTLRSVLVELDEHRPETDAMVRSLADRGLLVADRHALEGAPGTQMFNYVFRRSVFR